MGHCGNAPRQHTDDVILSLRKVVVSGSDKYHIPHLTFILNGDGELTEMKGRANEKPAKKYHPYIIKLLLNDAIKGIKGGGYAPENNFSLHDLDENVRKDLMRKSEGNCPGDNHMHRGSQILATQAKKIKSPGAHDTAHSHIYIYL